MRITAVAAAVPRTRATVRGSVTRVHTCDRPPVRTDVEIADGTGVIVLRFLGRSSVAGLAADRCVEAEGTPRLDGTLLVMLDPLYSLAPGG